MYKTHPNSAGKNQEVKKKKRKRSTNIKRNEISIMNIINDNTFNLHNSFLNNDNRNIKVILKFKQIQVAR